MIGQILWTSIASAGFQALLALAFSLVVRVTGIWNFTQAAIMGIAFYGTYVGTNKFGLPIFWAWLPTCALAIAAAVGIERFAFRTLRERNSEALLFFIFTLVFAQFVTFTLTLTFTSEPYYMVPRIDTAILMFDPIIVSAWDVKSISISAFTIAAIALFLRYSVYGQHLIAVADNADLAEVYGISKRKIYMITMAIAGLLVSVATFVYGQKLAYYPEIGLQLLIFAVTSTILGGIGRIFGAVWAAIGISLLQQFSVLFLSSRWQPLIVYGVLFVAIIVFPKGVRWPSPKLRRADQSKPAIGAKAGA